MAVCPVAVSAVSVFGVEVVDILRICLGGVAAMRGLDGIARVGEVALATLSRELSCDLCLVGAAVTRAAVEPTNGEFPTFEYGTCAMSMPSFDAVSHHG